MQRNKTGESMIIYGNTPGMWFNRFKTSIKNTNKKVIALFIIWSLFLWAI